MWEITQQGDEIIATHEDGRTLRIGNAQEAQELSAMLRQGEAIKLPEWLTYEAALQYARMAHPEKFPEEDVPYYDSKALRRITNAVRRGSIATKDDPSDNRRTLLDRDDFLNWLRNAQMPRKS